jgi:cell division protein FtsQ
MRSVNHPRKRPGKRPGKRQPGIALKIVGGITGAVLLTGGAVLNNSSWGDAGWMDEAIETARQRILTETARLGLAVDEVWVKGRRRTPAQHVFTALNLQRGIPLFGFDPAAAKERIEALPWVRRAAVERQMPDTVVIEITEYEPIALWQRAGQFIPIDQNGVAITEGGEESFANLPVVIGEQAPARTAQLFKTLATRPSLRSQIAAATLVGGRRWDLHLNNGSTVRLPEENLDAAWSRLAELERTHHLLSKDPPDGLPNDLFVVDLRLPDRLVLRRRPDKPSGNSRDGKDA